MLEKLNLNPFGLSEQRYDPIAAARMKADTYNGTAGDLTGYDCPKCRNRGAIAFPRDDGTIYTVKCKCMNIRKCIWEMERSGLKNIIKEKTLDTYTITEQWQNSLKVGAMNYAENPDGWLLFCGQSGSGKTHLCTAVCRQRLLAGDEVRYMSWKEKVSELKAMSLDNDRRSDTINGFKTAQILYIDDLFKVGRTADGSNSPSGADIGLAFEIINYRCVNHLPTIISTEKTPQGLVEIDEATGSRIVEMSGVNVYSIGRDSKRNYRLRGIREI